MKKEWTPEERKAFGDKMRAARAAKEVEQEVSQAEDIAGETIRRAERVAPPTEEQILSNDDVRDLLRRVKELEQNRGSNNQFGPQVGSRGNLVGTYEKYTIDPQYYPDPTARLAKEPRLQRFAFPINYELMFNVSTTNYQTQDGVNTREPKFTLELHAVVMDEETGEPTNGRYVLRRAIFHEDPQAAIVVAHENGVEVDESNQRSFLDEMRYLQMRNWLLEAFYPPKSTVVNRKKEMVIGNKVVEYFEVSSERPQAMPFGQLNTKL